MRAFQVRKEGDGAVLAAVEVAMPEPGPGEIRIRLEAMSLNYADLLMLGAAAAGGQDGRIPVTDGAGVIDAVGPGVHDRRAGDRVTSTFFQEWASGPFKASYGMSVRAGMLAEYALLPAGSAVAPPPNLSPLEAATLPCAALTAWAGLRRAELGSGDTLLVQGTGGVALFGLQFATALGARSIVLSSSDEKLSRARELGAFAGINYRRQPDWDVAVRAAAGGEGVSHVLELGGPGTAERSLRSLAGGGRIIQIGVLTGFGSTIDLDRLKALNADVIGVQVGSAASFREMNAFIAEHDIRPVIDRVFDFDDASAAYEHLRSGTHFGKVVIKA